MLKVIVYMIYFTRVKEALFMSIRIGILGYGNLGRGVEEAVKRNADLELSGVYTRRDRFLHKRR